MGERRRKRKVKRMFTIKKISGVVNQSKQYKRGRMIQVILTLMDLRRKARRRQRLNLPKNHRQNNRFVVRWSVISVIVFLNLYDSADRGPPPLVHALPPVN